MASETNNLPALSYYTPVELVGIYRSFIERGKSNNVVWLRGIYIQRPNQNPQWAAFYDDLRDVNSNVTVTLKINRQDRTKLKPNSLVQVAGLIELIPFPNGTIQIVVSVTRFEIVKDQFVTEKDLKRSEIRIAKTKKGFKNVDAILEDKLFRDERPKVALIFASTSITMADFNAGVNAAAVKIDFTEQRQSFGNAPVLATFLRQQDAAKYDVIALIRGGGSGIEALDEIEVLQAVSEMKTPVICAIGHVGEELFLKSIADKVAPTPNGLGQYFSEMVEKVTAKRNNSRAALVEEVRKQFHKQIEEANKKNKELLTQIEKMTNQAKEQTKAFQESQKKQQEENAKNLKKMQDENKKNLDAQQKINEEALNKLREDNKKNLDDQKKKNDEDLKKLREDNKKNLDAQQKRNEEALNKLREDNKKNLDDQKKKNDEDLKKLREDNQKALAQNNAQMESAKKQNDALRKQLKDLTDSQQKQLGQLIDQNKFIQNRLNNEQQHSRELEKKLANKSGLTKLLVAIAIAALAIGFILAKMMA